MKFPRLWLTALLVFCQVGVFAGEAVPDQTIEVGGGTIQVEFSPGLPVADAAILAWVKKCAVAVSAFLGHFPVKHVLIQIQPGGNDGVNNGVTYGGSKIIVHLGTTTGTDDLNHDWILTHEMFHLAFPTLPPDQIWMMEGLSDYLEPVARAQAGQLSATEVWKEMFEGLPQGLPAADDKGLDNTHTWARTYWGGEIFWLLADVQIRVKTDNRRGVRDAIRAILNAGGDGSVDWKLARVLKLGDQATGTTVLTDLHDQLGPQPGTVNLPDLWAKLGVSERNDLIHFNDQAAWAKIRVAITALPPTAIFPENLF